MTDAEVIKALECCSSSPAKCGDCPCLQLCDCLGVEKGALDLINRQKAEIEELKAENENQNSFEQKMWIALILQSAATNSARTEAIKEFARELRQQAFDRLYVSIDEINMLEKEMAGDTE